LINENRGSLVVNPFDSCGNWRDVSADLVYLVKTEENFRGLYNACNGYALYSCCVQLKCTIQAWIVLLIVLTLKIHNLVVKLNGSKVECHDVKKSLWFKKKINHLQSVCTGRWWEHFVLEI
jgi:hypothetical protein